jgi:chromosome segregation ATPase
MIIEQNDNQAHKIKVSNLKTQYDNQSNEFRIEKRRCEELIAEEGSRLRQKLDEKQKKIEILLERKQLLNNNLNELQAQNTSKMQKIEKSLKSSQRKAETHEEQMNKVLEKQKTFKLESLEEEIQEKEFQISKSKEKNEKLLDQLLRLEKILYGKSPLTNI